MKNAYLLTLLLAALTTSATAQVGVNNPTPTQTLDVNGKVKIADDATAPEAGTLRYNAAEAEFEGHDGTQWSPLSGGGALPRNAIPVHGNLAAALSKGQTGEFQFRTWTGNDWLTSPPAGKYIIVTAVLSDNVASLSSNDIFRVVLGLGLPGTSFVNGTGSLRFQFTTFSDTHIFSQGAPLFVISPGQALKTIHLLSSTLTTAQLSIRGFLVDDLNY